MINSKYFNKILAVLLVLALTVSVLLRYFPDVLPITNANSVTYEYESKLFDKDSVMDINIVVNEDDWNDLLENATTKEYIQCDIQINGETFSSVGIRAKGNTSLSSVASDDTTDRYSFKVEFDHYINQTCYGLDKLALNNIIQDATYMKEYMSYDLLTYMGVPTSLYSFANVSVNGETWGLYLAVEVPEESYAARNFGTSYGDLYKPESTSIGGGANADKTDKTDAAQNNFQDGMGAGQMGGMFGGQADTTTDGTTDGTMPEMPSGEMPTDGITDTTGNMFNKNWNQNGIGGGMGQGSGCDLVYSGDDLDNYSAIWDASVFDTTDSDHERVVEALKITFTDIL